MSQPGELGRPGTGERVLLDSDLLHAPADIIGSDLAHLFDYCRALLGQDREAIRTARSVLNSAHELLLDRERLRAWVFGLARSLAVALRLPGNGEASYMPDALIATASQRTDNGVLRAFRALTDRDREILDLVYRHGIRPAELPAVLIAPAEEVFRCLAHAEREFTALAAGQEACLSGDLADIAALPLAPLPAVEGAERQLPGPPAHESEGGWYALVTAHRPIGAVPGLG